uniref:hypothetical protein n=1 Tax=Klebsiella pneumoniae TaxID=573 RepID=UPI003D816D37
MRRKASLTSFRPKTSSEGGAGWLVVAAVPLSHQIACNTQSPDRDLYRTGR